MKMKAPFSRGVMKMMKSITGSADSQSRVYLGIVTE